MAVGGATSQFISGNNLVKPDAVNAGHQPRGYDQAMTYYQNFNVRGSTVKWTWVPSSAGADVVMGAIVDASVTEAPSMASVNNILELAPKAIFGSNTDGCAGILVQVTKGLTSDLSVAGFMDSTNTGSITTAPTQVWYHRCYLVNNHNSAATVGQLYWEVEYDCVFSEPLSIGAS